MIELVEGIRIFHDLREAHPRPPFYPQTTIFRDDTVQSVPSIDDILSLTDTRLPPDAVEPEVRFGRHEDTPIEDTQAFLTYQQQLAYQPVKSPSELSLEAKNSPNAVRRRKRERERQVRQWEAATAASQKRYEVNEERLRRLRVDDILRASGVR